MGEYGGGKLAARQLDKEYIQERGGRTSVDTREGSWVKADHEEGNGELLGKG